ncbi:MAG: DNA repair protein RecN [Oscillospiraceae bacterium]|nr:DNA repair protein RecN [Oscillospiraceae bacterium]
MLSSLFIQNVAVIEKAEFELTEGFNVFTGETGAGKTILINAINAVTGGRISKDIIRNGADKATISAVFCKIPAEKAEEIREYGYELEDEELIVSRSIYTDGKNVCRINGQPTTVAVLRDISKGMIDIYGQHDGRALLDVQEHIKFVDEYGNVFEAKEKYRQIYGKMKAVEKELDEAVKLENDKDRLKEFLEYQLNEITSANIRIGEEEELRRQLKIIKNAKLLEELFEKSREAALGDDNREGAIEELGNFADSIEELSKYYKELGQDAERIREIYYEVEEIYKDVRGFEGDNDYSPAQLDAIEDRLETIRKLEKKYGVGEKEVLEKADEMQSKLSAIEDSEARIEELRKEFNELLSDAKNAANELSLKREEAAKAFSEAVKSELVFLDMPNVKFSVSRKQTELTQNGADAMEFMISANPGEEPRALAKIASGGEMSRIMLSIKNATVSRDNIETIVFDEVDTGVSGRAAYKIGKKLKEVSKNRQVICVTHLAQVAAFGDSHMLITKHTENDRTFTEIRRIEGKDREYEIARIGGGDTVTETQIRNAKEMLESSK